MQSVPNVTNRKFEKDIKLNLLKMLLEKQCINEVTYRKVVRKYNEKKEVA